jgi:hypothetical protein
MGLLLLLSAALLLLLLTPLLFGDTIGMVETCEYESACVSYLTETPLNLIISFISAIIFVK